VNGETVDEFAINFGQAVEDQLTQHAGWLKRDAFVHLVGDYLIEDGALEDLTVCYYSAPAGRSKMEVAGFSISDDGRVLDLVVANYGHSGQVVPREQTTRQLTWLQNFALRCRDGYHVQMEESSPAFDMAQTIHHRWEQFGKIRLYLFTDGRSNIDALPEKQLDGLPVVQDLWDIERLRRLVTSGRKEEAIVVDLHQFGQPLRCLPAPASQDDYQCIFTVFPGELLAAMYEKYSSKLLQRNVRSFLQARGKVNKGINETIRTMPGRFLAYNNGISATATGVTIEERAGGVFLTKLEDLQIVNGGQTTASLHHAKVRDGADLSLVQVPAKITVVQPAQLDELVPRISRYANSQNAINEADFESNSPFHVELERLSRSLWAPAPRGSMRQTRWYYERVRGQYQVDLAKKPSGSARRRFEEDNPRIQRFSKTDAAKYDMTFRRRPHVVSLGAQKCFQAWTIDVLAAQSELPAGLDFQNLVAQAILFEQSRKIIQRLNPGAGYLANVTTYTVARLVDHLDSTAILTSLWREQVISPEVAEAVRDLSSRVREVLLAAPGSGNVTEWGKKEECWNRVQALSF
jgi:hypothetical protein